MFKMGLYLLNMNCHSSASKCAKGTAEFLQSGCPTQNNTARNSHPYYTLGAEQLCRISSVNLQEGHSIRSCG